MRRFVLLAALVATSAAQTVSWDAFNARLVAGDSANAVYQSGRYALAGPLYRDAAASLSGSDRASALYNAACSFALVGERDNAMAALTESVDEGWAQADHMQADTDPALLRDDAALRADWDRLVARTRENADIPSIPSSAPRIVTEDVPRF